MVYSLKSSTRTALISALNAHGFGFDSAPNAYDTKSVGSMTAVYLGKLVDSIDDEGNITYKDGWHADVLAPEGLTFDGVQIVQPVTPDHRFA